MLHNNTLYIFKIITGSPCVFKTSTYLGPQTVQDFTSCQCVNTVNTQKAVFFCFLTITEYCGWLRNPAPPGMIESPTKSW